MSSITYRTGTWLGIVRSGAVVVLDADTDPGITAMLWEFLAEARALDGILNEVTRAFDTELTEMPPFGILVHGERLHAVLRGDMRLEVGDGAEMTIVSGQNVTTWSEQSLPLPDSYDLALGAGSSAGGPADAGMDDAGPGWGATGTFLPLGEAVVRCGGLLYTRPSLPSDLATEPRVAAVPAPDLSGPEPFAPLLPEPELPPAVPPAVVAAAPPAVVAAAPPAVVAAAPAAVFAPASAAFDSAPTDSAPFDSAAFDSAPSADPASDPAVSEPLASTFDGESPGGPGDLGDHDAYARFALAADAEWRAQLDPESAIDLDADVDAPDDETSGFDDTDIFQPGDFDQEIVPADGGEFDALDTDTPERDDRQPEDPERVDPEPDGYEPGPHDPAAAGHGVGHIPPMPPTPPTVSAWASHHGMAEAAPEPVAPGQPSPEVPPQDLHRDESSADDAASHAYGDAVEPGDPAELGDPAGLDNAVEPDDAAELGDAAGPADAQEPGADHPLPATGPVVAAQLCPHGHANPPGRSACWDCGAAVDGGLVGVVRPRVGRMHISNGGVIDLDRSLIIGRLPSVDRVEGEDTSHLVQVDSGGEISRSHAEIRVDGWRVLLIDLNATNGTVLIRPGEDPRRLAPGEQVVLRSDDRADLGDGVILHFGEIL